MTDVLVGLLDAAAPGPLLGLLVGVLLGLSPLALPSIPAVMAAVGASSATPDRGAGVVPFGRTVPSIVAFTAGLNGVMGLLGYAFVSVTVLLARSAVVVHVVAAVTMVGVAGYLLTRRRGACARLRTIPFTPGAAFVYGVGFSVGGCPGCGPVALGVGSAAAALSGPAVGLLTVAAFIAGHAAVLIGAAWIGRRVTRPLTSTAWLRLGRLVGVLLLIAGSYYAFRVLSGEVTTMLPGEPGSGLLP